MDEIINRFISLRQLVCVYTSQGNPDSFICGEFLGCDESFFAFHMVSPHGIDDGYIVKPIASISRIEYDNKYCQKIQTLREESISACLSLNRFDMRITILQHALKSKAIVSVEINDSDFYDITGFVQKICDDTCLLELYDEYGMPDGYAYVNKHHITQVCCQSVDEMTLQKLIQLNTSTSNRGTVQNH